MTIRVHVSKVDYCNSLFAGMFVQLHDRLQSVLNAAARLIFTARKTDHISPLLRDLHWLRVPERVKFKLCVLALELCAAAAAPPPPPPTECRRRAGAVFVTSSRHVVHQQYVARFL